MQHETFTHQTEYIHSFAKRIIHQTKYPIDYNSIFREWIVDRKQYIATSHFMTPSREICLMKCKQCRRWCNKQNTANILSTRLWGINREQILHRQKAHLILRATLWIRYEHKDLSSLPLHSPLFSFSSEKTCWYCCDLFWSVLLIRCDFASHVNTIFMPSP